VAEVALAGLGSRYPDVACLFAGMGHHGLIPVYQFKHSPHLEVVGILQRKRRRSGADNSNLQRRTFHGRN
jgi:hypothetical protein